MGDNIGTYDTPNKRQRVGYNGAGVNLRMCPHCGRTFKRTEHLERHVRTHTKEKPFVCHCGASFARRDLLTRHQRLAEHEGDVPSPEPAQGQGHVAVVQQRNDSIGDPDLAAAVSLSGLSVDPWFCTRTQQPMQIPVAVPQTVEEQVQAQHQPGQGDDQFVPNFLSPQMLDSGVDFDTHFREFTSFLDGVGLSAEWSPFFGDPERHEDPVDPGLTQDENEDTSPRQGAPTRAGTPFSSWLPSAPTGNRISNYVSDTDNPRAVDPETRPFKVTEEQRSKLKASITDYSHLLDPAFCVPSRHALTRYVTSFFGGFHTHMPFIHIPTWQINDHSPELVFGIAAIGAQYCFESRASERLFFAGKALLMERLRRDADSFGVSSVPIPHVVPRSGRRSDAENDSAVETIRALITLMGFATWEPKASMVQESFALQSILTQVLRNSGLEDVDEPASPTPSDQPSDGNSLWHEWKTWIRQESNRRSKLIGFSFLHTHSIAYNVYPTLRSNEIGLRLPCSTKEWKAPTPILWRAAAKEVQEPQLFFREALSLLLKNKNDSAPLLPIPTPLGNYVLLHGLLQRIHIVRDLSLPITSNSAVLPSEEVEKLERGLRSWTSCWQQAPESTLDPNNENGPIPFTSSSLLSLAYVRIYLHLGPYRQLETRDPQRIANAIANSPDIERSDGVIAALLYSAHMIGIPVRLGVDRVARSQAFFWSVRHSLSGLDCAVLLSKWLSKLGETLAENPLSDSEDRILHWVRCIVEEAYTVVDFDQGIDTDNPSLLDFRDPSNLCLAVLKIWAHFFKSNTQWPFINIIGVGLEKYREILIHKNIG